jgi:ABC-type transporter Mla subunit MlaD
VNNAFHERYPHVHWNGDDDLCVRFSTDLRRVRVTMAIVPEELEVIRTESRATIVGSGPLGDQLVAITIGRGEPIPADGRIQSGIALFDEIGLLKERIDRIGRTVNRQLAPFAGFMEELGDDSGETPMDPRVVLAEAEQATADILAGQGDIGSVWSDPQAASRLHDELSNIRKQAKRLDGVLRSLEHDILPEMRRLTETAARIADATAALTAEERASLGAQLLGDPALGAELATDLADLRDDIANSLSVIVGLQAGVALQRKAMQEGSGGWAIVSKPALWDEVVKTMAELSGSFERNEALKAAARDVLEISDRRARP